MNTDWIREGNTVAIYRESFYGPGSYTTSTITKITKTQIVLANRQRYRRDRLTLVGGDGGGFDSLKLMPIDHTAVRDAAADEQFRLVARLVDNLAREHRNGRRNGITEVLAMLDKIERSVHTARQAIGDAPVN